MNAMQSCFIALHNFFLFFKNIFTLSLKTVLKSPNQLSRSHYARARLVWARLVWAWFQWDENGALEG
jgi:hypothetical protein